MLDPAPFAGPILVTVAYVAVYYGTQLHVLRVKERLKRTYAARGEKLDRYFGQDRELLAADRIQLNMLEHMPPFLALLWAHAVFVSTTGATVAGGVYVATRLAYPLLMGGRLGRSVKGTIMLATVPGYLVLTWLAGGLVVAAVGG